jgi:hypothetical protein
VRYRITAVLGISGFRRDWDFRRTIPAAGLIIRLNIAFLFFAPNKPGSGSLASQARPTKHTRSTLFNEVRFVFPSAFLGFCVHNPGTEFYH